MRASFVSGIPRRETCIQGPEVFGGFPPSERMESFCRLAEAQTPITKSGSRMFDACETDLPSFCRRLIGIFMMIEWVLKPATASRAVFGSDGSLPNELRVCPRSKIPPRSTKKGSSRGPQNTVSPVDAVAIADVASELYEVLRPAPPSIDRGPILLGGTTPFCMIVTNANPPTLFSHL